MSSETVVQTETRRRTHAILVLGVLGLILAILGAVALLIWFDGSSTASQPVDLTEQSDGGPTTGLSPAALAESCRDSPRPGCDALLTATCWDGPDGVTQHLCLTTPNGSGWEQLPQPYELPAKYIAASGSGNRIAVGDLLLDRSGQDQLQRLDGEHRWLGVDDRLRRFDDDGAMIITELDGTIIETIPPPVPSSAESQFIWRSWALSHDGSKFAVLSGIETSNLWIYDRDTDEWTQLHNDPAYLFFPFVTGVGFSPDNNEVITLRAAQDNEEGSGPLRRFEVVGISVEDGTVTTLREVVTDGGIRSSVSPNGRLMALANTLFQTRVLNLETLEVSDRVHLCCDNGDRFSWSPDDSFFITGGGNLVEVIPDAIPVANGPFDLGVPDPHGVSLPQMRFQTTPSS